MHRVWWLSIVLLAGPARGQVQRLVDTIESPVAYLCLEAMPASSTGERQPGAVQRLLADPSLDALFQPAAKTAAAGSLALVRGVLGRSSGELELALTGIVPNGGQPLLVLRARLQAAEADRMQMALDGGELGEPKRRLGGRTTYRLRAEGKVVGPGQDVELALVGADLVVGNDSTAMRELLEPPPPITGVGATRRVLSANPVFQGMKKQLPVVPGALWLYGDWQRLGPRLGEGASLPTWLMSSSGLGSARATMAAVSSAQADLSVTLLLDFAAPPVAAGRPLRPAAPGRPMAPEAGPLGIDGWFAAVQPVTARTLLPELPGGDLGGLVLSVDLTAVVARSQEGHHLLHDLHAAFDHYGLDFERHVLGRLGSRGTLQLHVGRSDAEAVVDSVYSLRTKNKKAAADLFADLRRVTEPAGLGISSTRDSRDARDRRSHELLELRHRDLSLFVTAHEDALLFANGVEPLVGVIDELRRNKPRPRRSEPVAAALATMGNENVAGLFDVDLQPWFEQIASAFTGRGARVDLSALPKRHVGSLDLQRRDDGTVVRLRVLSSR